MNALPVAGWYPDPAGSGRSRWWDGSAWTDSFQEAAPAAPQPLPVTTDSPFGPWGPATPAVAAAPVWAPPPTNPIAIVGFVLSIVGGGVISLVLSLVGLRRARGFAERGHEPVGRTLARWGVGLSIAGLLATVVTVGIVAAVIVQAVGYDERSFESALADTLAENGDPTTLVDCPAIGSYEEGHTLTCAIEFEDGTSGTLIYTMHGLDREPDVQYVQF